MRPSLSVPGETVRLVQRGGAEVDIEVRPNPAKRALGLLPGMFGILLLVLSVQFVLEKQGVLLAYLILIPVFLVISVLFCMAMLVFLQKWVASVDGDVVRWSWVFSLVPTRSIERRGIVSIAVRPLPFRWWETRSVRQYPRQERCTVVFVGGEAEASLVLRVEESIAWQLKSLFEQALE